jgi:hypothetical protein
LELIALSFLIAPSSLRRRSSSLAFSSAILRTSAEVTCSCKLHNSSIEMDFKESFSMNAPSGFPQGLTPFNRFGTMKKRHNRDKGHVYPPVNCGGGSGSGASAYPLAMAPQRAGAHPFSAGAGTLIIQGCANRFRFGPAYPISKLLKLFYLLIQYLNTKT